MGFSTFPSPDILLAFKECLVKSGLDVPMISYPTDTAEFGPALNIALVDAVALEFKHITIPWRSYSIRNLMKTV
jgi:hypothetical protein